MRDVATRLFKGVLIGLMLLSIAGVADAKTTKKKKKEKAAVAAVDMTNGVEPDGRKRASSFDRSKKASGGNPNDVVISKPGPIPFGKPVELQLKRAGSRHFDLRTLPHTRPVQQERAELPEPAINPVSVQGIPELPSPSPSAPITPAPLAPAPPPTNVFEGLDRFNWGAGSPPDTNGDVGPNDYIQTVNTSIGVFNKNDGTPKAEFTFNTFMSQGNFGNLCDTNNFGDPVVLYDSFEDRWIITDFAFLTDISGNVVAPAYQCFAASMSGDPVSGGWNFYSIQISDALNDYPKLGIWPDGLYMSANLFTFGAGSSFKNARAWAFNKAQMYAGSPTVKVVSFDIGGGDFAVMPSNARLQTGTPPPGRPNLFVSTWEFLNALTVYKFHVDWDHISLSTFTGPDVPLAATSWPNAGVANVPQSGTSQLLDALQIRAMVQNQYTNLGGAESLWIPHTVRRANTTGFAAPRWYQVNVTAGTVGANLPQATTWDPDGANVMHRWMPSLALDRAGNMAMGYSTSSSSTFPSMKYAGRLAADSVNTFSQTEQTFFTGTASQLSSTRWGDYSSVTLDPDGCTFWLTNEYATGLDNTAVDPTSFNKRWQTKFGRFGPFPGCVPVGAGGTVSGTVTTSGNPLPAATVTLGARSTTTDASGNYAFNVPAGVYPSMTAGKAGFVSASAASIAVIDGNTTTQNFSLTAAPASACITDTTQADFQAGVPSTNVDLNASPGDVLLSNAPSVDQLNTAGTTTGTSFGTPSWTGQTFIAGLTGQLVAADVTLFCVGCGATPPNLTLSVRGTSAGLPTGADLATASIPGSAFASGSTVTYTANFGAAAALTSGTQYALILHPNSAPAGSGYFWIRSSPSTYANGSRVLSADSGSTWSADTTRDYNFKTYMNVGYRPAGDFTSSPKDANPAGAITPIWQTFSWNATTPANTSIQFQLAGSNNVNGPFTFVGPDGTAGTFFTTSPVQLSPQFYNFRYLEYKAFLATTNSAVTPALNDATFCFNDVDCSGTAATITAASPVCGLAGHTASGPPGMTSYAWGIANGTITSATNTQSITFTASTAGIVTLTLTVTAPNGCIVSGSTPVTVNATPLSTITISNVQSVAVTGSGTFSLNFNGAQTSPLATGATAAAVQAALNALPTIGGVGGSTNVVLTAGTYAVTFAGTLTGPQPEMTATASAGVTATVKAPPVCPGSTGNQASGPGGLAYGWAISNGVITSATNVQTVTYTAGTTGDVLLTLTVTDGNNCSASSAPADVPIDVPPPTPTIGATTNGTGTTDQACPEEPLTLTATGVTGAVSYQWYQDNSLLSGQTSSTYQATGAATYYVTATDANGCTTAKSAGYVVFNPTPHSAFITADGTMICSGGSVHLSSDSATGIQWYKDGVLIPGANSQDYTATAAGTYTAILDALGCHSSVSNSITLPASANPAPDATITAPATVLVNSSNNAASVPDAGAGATYNWAAFAGNITSGGGTRSITFKFLGTGVHALSVTITLPTGCTTYGSVNVSSVSSMTATHFSVSAPSTVTNGSPFSVVVTALDSTNSPVTNYSGTIHFTSSSAGTLPSDYTFTGAADNGSHSFNVTLTNNGAQTVSVTDGTNSGSAGVTVNCPTLTVTASNDGPACASVNITANTANSGVTFAWTGPGGFTSTQQSVSVTTSGTYTVTIGFNGCTSESSSTTVTVNPTPPAPTVTPSGPTTFCTGGSVTLTSSSATGNQWYVNFFPAPGATGQTYVATATGSYAVRYTDANGCTAMSAVTSVTVNPTPTTASIYTSGPTTFCAGGSVTLTASNAPGDQWYLNGAPIGGATSQTYIATASGDYTVVVTSTGCSSAPSAATTVTVNSNPSATITASSTISAGSTGNIASVASAGAGATYNWSITNGVITAGSGTNSITFTAGAVGTLTLQVTVTTAASCADTKSANVTVAIPPVTVTSVSPTAGSINGHTAVTVNGTGFHSGATLTFGGTAATSIVVVSTTKITAVTPAHAAGQVNVTVTNTDTSTGTLTNGYTYAELFDPNGDHTIDPSDIFYLINYLFMHGPAPVGGTAAGDANGDGVVDPSDIFYLVNYLFLGGPKPYAEPVAHIASASAPVSASMKGSISLGQAVLRGDRYVIPVSVEGSPSAMSLRLRFDAAGEGVTIHRASGLQPAFEIARHGDHELTYLVDYDGTMNDVVATIEVPSGTRLSSIEIAPDGTLLCDRDGIRKATVAAGTLTVKGTSIDAGRSPIKTPRSER